jgi:hypothetical protein
LEFAAHRRQINNRLLVNERRTHETKRLAVRRFLLPGQGYFPKMFTRTIRIPLWLILLACVIALIAARACGG